MGWRHHPAVAGGSRPDRGPAGGALLAELAEAAPGASAVAVAARCGGHRLLAATGGTAHHGGRAADPHTRFETGSVTKTFTALLLAEMVACGEVGYTDPITRYLPPGALPGRGAVRGALRGGASRDPLGSITLLHLATHTAGLPRLPPGFLRQAAPRWFSNPYERFGTRAVLAALARTRPHPAPGTRVRYSNFGVGLLGLLLARAAGLDYAELLASRVLAPLGLYETDCAADREQATGYWHRRPRPSWRIPGLPAAGALRSSAHDLLHYLDAHIAATAERDPMLLPAPYTAVFPVPDPTALADPDAAALSLPGAALGLGPPGPPAPASLVAALADVARPRLAVPGGDRIGLVWNVRSRPGHELYFHTGGTRGCTAFAGFSPQRRVAFAALANSSPTLDGAFLQRAYLTLRELAADPSAWTLDRTGPPASR
ncbi:hypothetical protein ACZ90_06400 [Streptomyces albus subsp. albus]|nr:hypothetical protein ACZ90_06400 [Streptomyces albus subsp. albus]